MIGEKRSKRNETCNRGYANIEPNKYVEDRKVSFSEF